MAYVESVIAAILPEVERILRGLRFVGSTGIADAVAVSPLQAGSQPLAEPPVHGGLQRVVVIRAAAGLVIDLGKPRAELKERRPRSGHRIGGHSYDPISPGTQEQVTPLPPYI